MSTMGKLLVDAKNKSFKRAMKQWEQLNKWSKEVGIRYETMGTTEQMVEGGRN